jgi:hypothetical protein
VKGGATIEPCTHISFTADPPEDSGEPHPPGHDIARWLCQRLAELGWRVKGVEAWRGVGWSVVGCIEDRRFSLDLAYVGDGPRQWLLSCGVAKGRGPAVQRRLQQQEDVNTLAQTVHQTLSDEPRFGELRWYTQGFRCSEADPWSPRPPKLQ